MQPTTRELVKTIMHDAFRRGFFQRGTVLIENINRLQLGFIDLHQFLETNKQRVQVEVDAVRLAADVVKGVVLTTKTMTVDELKDATKLIETLARAFVAYSNPAPGRRGSLNQFGINALDISRWTGDILHAHEGDRTLWTQMNGRLLLAAANLAEIDSGSEGAIKLYAGASIGGDFANTRFILEKFADPTVQTPSPKEDPIVLEAYMGVIRCVLTGVAPDQFHYVEKIAKKLEKMKITIYTA